jgi:predicted nucleotidyltransferase
VVATCIYGSRVAGYNRPDSDIDLLVVLQNYPYVVKYIYFSESGTKISALAVDREALLRDAKRICRRPSASYLRTHYQCGFFCDD